MTGKVYRYYAALEEDLDGDDSTEHWSATDLDWNLHASLAEEFVDFLHTECDIAEDHLMGVRVHVWIEGAEAQVFTVSIDYVPAYHATRAK